MDDAPEKSELAADAIEVGCDVAGGLVGAGAGMLLAGPMGAAIGAVAAPVVVKTLENTVGEFIRRQITARQEHRVEATVRSVADQVNGVLAAGGELRTDGFFEDLDEEGRSAADEVFEAVLGAAKDEYEEKKLRYYGSLVASIATDATVSRPQANLLVRLFEQLSYHQLCLLTAIGMKQLGVLPFPLRDGAFVAVENPGVDRIGVYIELWDLYSRGLLNGSGEAFLGLGDIKPAKLEPQGVGAEVFNRSGGWNRSNVNDVVAVAEYLR